MTRFRAENWALLVVTVLLAPVAMAPGLALAWYRLKGNVITMNPLFEVIVWGFLIGGAGTLVQGVLRLIRGR